MKKGLLWVERDVPLLEPNDRNWQKANLGLA